MEGTDLVSLTAPTYSGGSNPPSGHVLGSFPTSMARMRCVPLSAFQEVVAHNRVSEMLFHPTGTWMVYIAPRSSKFLHSSQYAGPMMVLLSTLPCVTRVMGMLTADCWFGSNKAYSLP